MKTEKIYFKGELKSVQRRMTKEALSIQPLSSEGVGKMRGTFREVFFCFAKNTVLGGKKRGEVKSMQALLLCVIKKNPLRARAKGVGGYNKMQPGGANRCPQHCDVCRDHNNIRTYELRLPICDVEQFKKLY